jgi:site-specific DNA-methyltransferase (adenine-specific)
MVGGSPLNSHKMPLKQTEDICIFSPATLGNHTYNPQLTKKHTADKRPTKDSGIRKKSVYGESKGGYSESYSNENQHPTTLISIHSKAKECNTLHRIHPTQKPISLMTTLIRTYSNEYDLILDNCMGSGSTIIAAIRENRNYIGIEKNNKIFNTAHKRIQHELSQTNLFKP